MTILQPQEVQPDTQAVSECSESRRDVVAKRKGPNSISKAEKKRVVVQIEDVEANELRMV